MSNYLSPKLLFNGLGFFKNDYIGWCLIGDTSSTESTITNKKLNNVFAATQCLKFSNVVKFFSEDTSLTVEGFTNCNSFNNVIYDGYGIIISKSLADSSTIFDLELIKNYYLVLVDYGTTSLDTSTLTDFTNYEPLLYYSMDNITNKLNKSSYTNFLVGDVKVNFTGI